MKVWMLPSDALRSTDLHALVEHQETNGEKSSCYGIPGPEFRQNLKEETFQLWKYERKVVLDGGNNSRAICPAVPVTPYTCLHLISALSMADVWRAAFPWRSDNNL